MIPRRLRPEGGRAHQGGYALVIVLVVVGFCSLILVALLGLVSTDSSTNSGFVSWTRARRSADGALQVALTRLKTAPANVIAADGPCGNVNGSTVAIEGRPVSVSCTPIAVNDPPVASPGTGGTVLTLVGNYDGNFVDGPANNIGGALGAIISGGAQLFQQFLANGPGLVHVGGEPLRIVGDVKVRQSALAARAPGPSPAIDIVGNYVQGDLGALGGIDIRLFDLIPIFSTPKCGTMDTSFPDNGADLGLEIRATGTLTCAPAGGRNAVTPAGGPSATAPATWTSTMLRTGTALPTCTPGAVVAFAPGAYNRLQTAQMNQWFKAGNCDDVTFWFQPGNYYFDVGGWDAGDRNSLTLDDHSSNWVFGAPKGWDPSSGRAPASAFPEACDSTASGVTITLSSRTVIKHRDGLAAVCGAPLASGATPTAIYQETAAATQKWAAVPTAAGPPTSCPSPTQPCAMTPAVDATASVPPAPASFPALGGDFNASEGATRKLASQSCKPGQACSVGLKLGGFLDLGEPAPSGDLTGAVLKITGSSSGVEPYAVFGNGSNVKTYVRIAWGDGSGGACTIETPDVPRSVGTTFTVDIWNTCHSFPYDLTDASQLEGATVEVTHTLVPAFCFLCVSTPKVSMDYAWIETTTTTFPPSTFSVLMDPAAGKAMHVFGTVHMPRTQIELRWDGSADRVPVFVGGVVARALASVGTEAGDKIGVAVAKTMAPPRRRVLLRATVNGQVVATAQVELTDNDASGMMQDPGRLLEVLDWSHCGDGEC